jgi:hypothetical protein
MKVLTGLDTVLSDFTGAPVKSPLTTDRCPTCGQPLEQTVVTAKKLLTDIIGRGLSQDPIHAMEVGRQIFRAGSEVTLEESDLTLINTLVDADQASNLVKGLLLPMLTGAVEAPPSGEDEA